MTKSNREAKGEMGGNVLDMQMTKGKPAVIESRTYEPGEYPDPDAQAADAPEWPWARVASVAGTGCNETSFTFDGTRYVTRYPKDSTAAEIARAIAAMVPGAKVQGETVAMPPHSGARIDSMTIGGLTAPSEPVTFCNRATKPLTMQGVRDAAARLLRGDPAREQVKARAREALRSANGYNEYAKWTIAVVTIACEQNSGLRDTYVVRLNSAPQFTTYDMEEALDIFADMVTGEPAARGKIGSDTLDKRQNIARLSGPAGDLRGLAGTVREAVITGARIATLDGVTVGVYVNREPAALHVVTGAPVIYIAGCAANLTSLALALDDAAEQGSAVFLPASGCMVSVARTEAKTAAASPARNPDPAPRQVWAPPLDGWAMARAAAQPDGTLTVRQVSSEMVVFNEPYCVAEDITHPAEGWRCIGIETPHGRVMVGDGFVSAPGVGPVHVSEVIGSDVVLVYQDGDRRGTIEATDLLGGYCGYRRTCYAPARAGERLRWRTTGQVATVAEGAVGRKHDASKWERLDPGQAERAPVAKPEADEPLIALLRGVRMVKIAGISIGVDTCEERNGGVVVSADVIAPVIESNPIRDAALCGAPVVVTAVLSGKSASALVATYHEDNLTGSRGEHVQKIRVRLQPVAAPSPVTITSPDDVDSMFGKGSELGSVIKLMMSGESLVLSYRTPRPLANPGGIPAAAPEPTEEQRVAAAILERRCLDTGTPRREGEDDATLTARLDAAERDRLLARAIAKGRPWLVGVAYAREGHTVTLPDARAFTAALDALVSERDVDAAVDTFRRARMATGPTWLRPALERAARELTGAPAYMAPEHSKAAPRVQRTRWADPCAWASAVNFWERETR